MPARRLPVPNAKLLLKLILALAVALATWYALRYPYSHVVTGVGARILSLLSDIPPEEIIRVRQGEFYLDTGLVRSSGQPMPFVRLPVYQVHWNSILFLSLVLISPLRLWRTCWRYLLVALAVLLVSHVAFFTLTVFGEIASRHSAAGLDIVSGGTIRAVAFTVQIYSLIVEKALPFLLFVPVFVAWRKPPPAGRKRPAKVRSRRAVGRNSLCPCGSGKKYKHCCL